MLENITNFEHVRRWEKGSRFFCWSLGKILHKYLTRLRHLAHLCKFEALLDDFICDRLVLGTNANSACARMFREKNLTLDAAINICRVSELSKKQLKEIKKSKPDVQFVQTWQRGKAKHQKHADKAELRDCKSFDK